MKNLLWFILFLVQSALSAQVKLKPASINAENTLIQIGYQNMQSAWIVAGTDTVYRFHFSGDTLVSCKSPFEEDSVWYANDSCFHQNLLYQEKIYRLTVYYQGKIK